MLQNLLSTCWRMKTGYHFSYENVNLKLIKDFNAISINVKGKYRDNSWIYTHRPSLSEKDSNSSESNHQNWKTVKNEAEKPLLHKGNTQQNEERPL